MTTSSTSDRIPLRWAREHIRRRSITEDVADFYPWHGQPLVHFVHHDPPIPCPTCRGTARQACRGHSHDCEDCMDGTVTVTLGPIEACPLCWDLMVANLANALVGWVSRYHQAEREAKHLQ